MLSSRGLRAAAGQVAVAIAGLVLGAAIAGAVRGMTLSRSRVSEPDRAAAVAPATVAESPEGAPERAARLPEEILERAAERAPFSPERQASSPYLLPEERVVPEPVRIERPEPPPAPAFRVLGTITGGDGGIAVIEAPGEPPRMVTMGDEILGFRLSRIEQGRVVLGDEQGRSVSVAVPDVAPRTAAVEPEAPRGRQNQNANRNANGGRGGAAGGNAFADAVNAAMARMREQSGGDVRMEMRGDRVILTGADGTRREITIGRNGGGGGR
jgi:hypothetical protein